MAVIYTLYTIIILRGEARASHCPYRAARPERAMVGADHGPRGERRAPAAACTARPGPRGKRRAAVAVRSRRRRRAAGEHPADRLEPKHGRDVLHPRRVVFGIDAAPPPPQPPRPPAAAQCSWTARASCLLRDNVANQVTSGTAGRAQARPGSGGARVRPPSTGRITRMHVDYRTGKQRAAATRETPDQRRHRR